MIKRYDIGTRRKKSAPAAEEAGERGARPRTVASLE
jgi:hypothetical protein